MLRPRLGHLDVNFDVLSFYSKCEDWLRYDGLAKRFPEGLTFNVGEIHVMIDGALPSWEHGFTLIRYEIQDLLHVSSVEFLVQLQ